jgi:hypothetical protein
MERIGGTEGETTPGTWMSGNIHTLQIGPEIVT